MTCGPFKEVGRVKPPVSVTQEPSEGRIILCYCPYLLEIEMQIVIPMKMFPCYSEIVG